MGDQIQLNGQFDYKYLSGANGDREESIFPVQLTTSRIGNLTRLILSLAICDDHTYTRIYTHYA